MVVHARFQAPSRESILTPAIPAVRPVRIVITEFMATDAVARLSAGHDVTYDPALVDAENLPFRRFSVAAQNRLRNYPWPGNMGELRNMVGRLLMLGSEEEISLEEVEAELSTEARETELLVQQDLLAMPLREASSEVRIAPDGARSLVTWTFDYRVKYGPLGWLMGQTVMKMKMVLSSIPSSRMTERRRPMLSSRLVIIP